MRLAGVWDKQIEDALPTMKGPEERHVRRSTAGKIWDALVALATDPPRVYDELCAMVARSRTLADKERYSPMSDNPAAEGAEVRVPRSGGMNPNLKVNFLKDDDGELYGPDNNPFGAGRSERFAQLRQGMTVGEMKEAGLSAGNIRFYVKEGVIELVE